MLGPVGMVAHPPSTSRAKDTKMLLLYVLMMSSLPTLWWTWSWNNLHPAAGTLFHIWVISLGFRTEIPVTLLFLYRSLLFIYWSLLLHNGRLRVVIRIGRCAPPPPWPYWADPNTTPHKAASMRIHRQHAYKEEYNNKYKEINYPFHVQLPLPPLLLSWEYSLHSLILLLYD